MAVEGEEYEIQEGSEVPIIDDPSPGIIATSLAPQLASADRFLTKGQIDMRLLSIIRPGQVLDYVYAKIRSKKSRTWRLIYDEMLHLNVSVDGRGRRDIIRMEEVSHGGSGNVEAEIREPGWLDRNVTNRNWELQQRREAMDKR